MILALLLAEAASPASPQPEAIAHLKTVVVEAIRNCPAHQADEIVVCAPDRGIAEGYRIPKLDPRFAGERLRPSGRGTLAGPALAASGTGSCSTSGAGGATGCSLKEAQTWGDWKRERKAEGQQFPW